MKEFRQDMNKRRNSKKKPVQKKIVARKVKKGPKRKRTSSASSPSVSVITSPTDSPAPSKNPRKRTKRMSKKAQAEAAATASKKTFKYPLGTKIARDFDGDVFEGEITKLYPDDEKMAQVTYTDGDKEDLDEEEVQYGIGLFETTFDK